MNEEIQIILETTEKVLQKNINHQLRQNINQNNNDIINVWNEIEEIGLPKIVVKEKFDGFNLEFASVLPIIQVSNSLGAPIPLSETILCNYILSECDINPPEGMITFANVAKNIKISGNELSGELISVPYLNLTDKIMFITKIDGVEKVVFFVDDLDRIPPTDAVEVLESLKNIFDIPNCIFIIAIDYEVVVKGLEGKFGPKTKENEREFRYFFDKIIQVPFTMPVGAYDITSFLKEKLKKLSVDIEDEKVSLVTKIVGYTVGNNPRSLKRYLNTFSLINQIIEDDDENDKDNENIILLFAVLGIQISYPKIFRILTQNANFLFWDKEFGNKIGIDLDKAKEDLKKVGESELTDEAWEQVIWGFCQTDPFLKVKCISILELLNFLREITKDEIGKKWEENSLHDQLSSVLEFAAITNVDDDLATKQAVSKVGSRTYYEGIDGYILENKESSNYSKEHEAVLIAIDKKLREIYADKISSENILIDYSKTGGLVLNWKKKSGGKFFQIRFGKTDSFIDAEKKHFLQCYIYKSSKDYQHPEILSLFPAQSMHSKWMFYCVIRDLNDFEILLNSKLIDKGIEANDQKIKYLHPSNLEKTSELKPYFKEDIEKVQNQGIKF